MSEGGTDPNIEANGRTISLVSDGLRELSDDAHSTGQDILASYGVRETEPDGWYPLGDWVTALEEIADALGDDAIRHLGTKIPERADWPSGVESVSAGFSTINEAYQRNHRGGDPGYYRVQERDDREISVVCANPYPCLYDEGIFRGVLQEFSHNYSYSPMVFIHETSDHCRSDGGDQCTYRVSW